MHSCITNNINRCSLVYTQDSPGWKKKALNGLIGKAFKKNVSGGKMDRIGTVATPDILSDIQ